MANSLKQQLTGAIKDCRRQLEILRAPWTPLIAGGPPNNQEEIAMMEAEIQRLTEALANLGPEDA